MNLYTTCFYRGSSSTGVSAKPQGRSTAELWLRLGAHGQIQVRAETERNPTRTEPPFGLLQRGPDFAPELQAEAAELCCFGWEPVY